MTGRRSTAVACLLCMLAIGAIGAATASAGQTVYRCVPFAATRDFTDAHCTNKVAPQSNYGHEAFATSVIGATNADTASGTTASTPTNLKSAIAGIEIEVTCATAGGMGELTNAAESFTATGTLEYGSCTVAKPAGKGCKVSGGAITTKELAISNAGLEPNTIKIAPNEGTEFASAKIEGCEVAALNKSFAVTGSMIASVIGSTVITTHTTITSQNTLKLGGNKAGIEGTLTFKALTEYGLALT